MEKKQAVSCYFKIGVKISLVGFLISLLFGVLDLWLTSKILSVIFVLGAVLLVIPIFLFQFSLISGIFSQPESNCQCKVSFLIMTLLVFPFSTILIFTGIHILLGLLPPRNDIIEVVGSRYFQETWVYLAWGYILIVIPVLLFKSRSLFKGTKIDFDRVVKIISASFN